MRKNENKRIREFIGNITARESKLYSCFYKIFCSELNTKFGTPATDVLIWTML